MEIDLSHSHLNADAAFDTKEFIETLENQYQMIANIPKNKRNQKKIQQQTRTLNDYIYQFRRKIETVFA